MDMLSFHFKFLIIIGLFYIVNANSVLSDPIGNLAVILNHSSLVSAQFNPLVGFAKDLWCGAEFANNIQILEKASFVRLADNMTFPAVYKENRTMAFLKLGKITVFNAGAYRCDLTTVEGDQLHGLLYVLARPILIMKTPIDYEIFNQTIIRGRSSEVNLGETIVLSCPIFGYPTPNITWFKDDVLLENSNSTIFTMDNSAVHIKDVDVDDFGTYRCSASNNFTKYIDTYKVLNFLHLELKVLPRKNKKDLTQFVDWRLKAVIFLIFGFLLTVIGVVGYLIWSGSHKTSYYVSDIEQRRIINEML